MNGCVLYISRIFWIPGTSCMRIGVHDWFCENSRCPSELMILMLWKGSTCWRRAAVWWLVLFIFQKFSEIWNYDKNSSKLRMTIILTKRGSTRNSFLMKFAERNCKVIAELRHDTSEICFNKQVITHEYRCTARAWNTRVTASVLVVNILINYFIQRVKPIFIEVSTAAHFFYPERRSAIQYPLLNSTVALHLCS